jgi:hypothetical protein
MTTRIVYCLFIAMAALPATPASAIDRPTFYKVFQFPPDQIPRIDGDPSDWDIVPDDYVIGMDQLSDDAHIYSHPDPKKLDVKIRVGWVKGLNRLYFLYEAYKDYWDFSQPNLHNDIFELVVDGSRFGGKFIARFRPDQSVNEWDAYFAMQGAQAQNYHIFTPAKDKDWCMAWGPQQWLKELPYANHAIKYNFQPGEGGKLVLEFYITPFDNASADGPEHSTETQLTENKMISLCWAIMDYRGPQTEKHAFWNLSPGHTMYGDASLLMPFKLMPLEPKFIKPGETKLVMPVEEPKSVKPFEARWTFHVVDMAKRLVAFQDQSSGQVTSWHWDFGDKTTSDEQNPQHTYKDPGNYIVVLDITGPAGKSRFSRVWDVTVK